MTGTPETADELNWYANDVATFGDRVAGAREAAGMSQEDVARRLGVKLATVQNWEGDAAEPRANKLQMLAGLLSVSIAWLLTGNGEGPDAPEDAVPAASEVTGLLAELRQTRVEAQNLATRIGVLEKQLRRSLQAA